MNMRLVYLFMLAFGAFSMFRVEGGAPGGILVETKPRFERGDSDYLYLTLDHTNRTFQIFQEIPVLLDTNRVYRFEVGFKKSSDSGLDVLTAR